MKNKSCKTQEQHVSNAPSALLPKASDRCEAAAVWLLVSAATPALPYSKTQRRNKQFKVKFCKFSNIIQLLHCSKC